MKYKYIPYIWLLITSAIISLSLGIYAFIRKKNAKCAPGFILSMFVVTLWSGANALEMSSSDFATKLFWANMQYFSYCYSPVTLLTLCMQFTGNDRWVQNKRILWIAVVPTIIILLVWTDGLHGLIRYDMHMDYSGYFPVIGKKYGPVFYIHVIYSHVLNLASCGLLIKAAFFNNSIYRKQTVALLLGASFIVIPNVLYVLGFSLVKRFDTTPIFFGPAGLIMTWSIFHFKFFDLVPIARAKVIEIMDAGVMVLDLQNRVLDINPAFEKIVGLTFSRISARKVEEVCSKIPELEAAYLDRTVTHTEFTINRNASTKVYEVFFSPLIDSKGVLIGRLGVTYEITEKKQAQLEFLKQQWKLAVIEERERIARDLHDNIGQVLGFISLQAQGIKQELTNAGVEIVSQELDKLVDAAQTSNSDLREYIHNARIEKTTEQDFISALQQYILSFEEKTGLKVKLDIPFQFSWEQLSPNIRLNILKIVKEALNNIRKHAEAKNILITFSVLQEQLCAFVEDDGNGFDTDQCYNGTKTRFGLSIMRERALEIGAQINIKSTVGKGSRISLYVPLKEEEKNADESDAGR